MSDDQKTQSQRQQDAAMPHRAFGPVRIRAVAAATCVKPKTVKAAEPKRDLPPLLRRDQFFD